VNINREAGGRFINDRDRRRAAAVAVLGTSWPSCCSSRKAPVGQQVFLGDTPFTVWE